MTVGGSTLAGSDARFQSLTGAVHTAAVTAGRDVVIDAVTLVDDGATGSNPLSAGRDVAVNAASGGVTLTSAGAADDVVLRAGGSVMTGTLTSGTGADAVGAGDVLAGGLADDGVRNGERPCVRRPDGWSGDRCGRRGRGGGGFDRLRWW